MHIASDKSVAFKAPAYCPVYVCSSGLEKVKTIIS